MFFNQYPYLNLNDFNLDYILKTLRVLSERLENFISLNTIKYANPIQWNITKQYEANTVVIDANDSTAYLSVQPVPTGVAITNTDYWTPIFTLNLLSANQNITLRDDGANTLATFTSAVGDWLIWNGILYKVTRAIAVNEAYIVGYNLTRYSVELFLKDAVDALNTAIDNVDTKIGELTDLTTTDKTDIVTAINEVNAKKIYNISVTPEQFGAVGDGVTDDSTAMQDAIDYAIANKCSVVATKTYNVHNIVISNDINNGFTFIFNKLYANSDDTVLICEGQNITLIGNSIINDNGNCLQCGYDNYGFAGSTVTINYLKSALHSTLYLKAHTDQNVQDDVFNISRMVHYEHGVVLDTTDRYIGEITFNGTWFNNIEWDGRVSYAIVSDCANYGMTGLTLNACSFEGSAGGIQVLNTGLGVQHQFAGLYGFELRTSELTLTQNQKFLDYHGTGRFYGAITVDDIRADAFVFNDALGDFSACKFTVSGRFRYGGLIYKHGELILDGMYPVMDETGIGVTSGAKTDSAFVRAFTRVSSDASLTVSTSKWSLPICFIVNANVTFTFNGTAYGGDAKVHLLKIYCWIQDASVIRYAVEDSEIALQNPS